METFEQLFASVADFLNELKETFLELLNKIIRAFLGWILSLQDEQELKTGDRVLIKTAKSGSVKYKRTPKNVFDQAVADLESKGIKLKEIADKKATDTHTVKMTPQEKKAIKKKVGKKQKLYEISQM